MGKNTREVTTYSCDYCRTEQAIDGPWWGFNTGRTSLFTFSGQYIFCKEVCVNAWLTSNGKALKLTRGDMNQRFPHVSLRYHETIGNTD